MPLSHQQERLWLDAGPARGDDSVHRDGARPAVTAVRVEGPFEVSLLRRATTELTRRHEVLRTTFREDDGRPWQVIHPNAPAAVSEADLSGLPPGERATRLGVALQEDEAFDLTRLPLVRWTAVRLGPEEYEIVLRVHPAVLDTRSADLLVEELSAIYSAFAKSEEPPLGDRPVQYADYALWQREVIASAAMRARLARRRRRLADLPPPVELPPRGTRPEAAAQGGRATVHADLPAGLVPSLQDQWRAEGVSLFTVALAAFAALLHRYSGASDICVLSRFAGRRVPGTETLLGPFADTVALRCDLGGDPSIRDLAVRVQAFVREAEEDQEYPFAELVRVLNRRGPARGPLSSVTFTLDDTMPPRPDFAGSPGTLTRRVVEPSDTPLAVALTAVSVSWEYDENAFDPEIMRQLLEGYLLILQGAVTAPGARLSELPLLSESRRRLLAGWRGGEQTRPAEPLVHTAVARQARRTPAAVAVRDGDRTLTYGELDARADRVAASLQELGTGPDDVVGVLLPRGIPLVVAELGVLKAGAAYLPLDPDHPADRLAFLCRDAGAAHVVTTDEHLALIPGGSRALSLDRLPVRPGAPAATGRALPRDLAYVMYTSGSTGRPKGVMIEHASLANFTGWYRREYAVTPADRLAMINAPGFDASIMDLWPALTAGASIHVADQDTRLTPARLQAWLVDNEVATVFLTTALAEALLALPWPREVRLRSLQAGGEALRSRPGTATPFRLDVGYGLTEHTVLSTVGAVGPATGPDEPYPDIGRPIAGTVVHVLNAALRPVPPGVRGELYVGGPGVARGYLGRPGLTAERFVPDPFGTEPGGRLYRTGDLARFLPDGRLEFLGRTDSQVKLRGNRVEPGEIEAALRRHPAVAQVHVAVRDDGPGGEKRLVAYLVPRAGQEIPPAAGLREHLERDLPSFMIPAAWVALGLLPLNANGKVDAGALPSPDQTVHGGTHEPPATATERTVAGIWSEVLRLPEVGVLDNFFDLGGHSMLVFQVRDRLVERLGHSPPILDFFRYPTVRTLAGHIDGGEDRDTAPEAGDRRRGLSRLQSRRARGEGPG